MVGPSYSRTPFTPEGSGYLDRRDQVGAVERDMFLAVYRRDGRRHFWAAMLGVMVVVGPIVALFEGPYKGVTVATTLALVGLPGLLHPRAWHQRERALARRFSRLPALSRAAARRRILSQVTWGNRVLGPVVALVPASRAWCGEAVLGWSALWPVPATGPMVTSAVQVWRTWRAARLG